MGQNHLFSAAAHSTQRCSVLQPRVGVEGFFEPGRAAVSGKG